MTTKTTLTPREKKLVRDALYMAVLWEESRIDAGVTMTRKLLREAQENIEKFTQLRISL